MLRARTLLLLTSLSGPATACFTGDAALGLPCADDLACGEGQVCLQELCSLPGVDPCGNGLLNPGEECDEGEANADGGACTLACRLAACGDGLAGPSEACDPADPEVTPGTCTPACALNTCGDGFVGAGESCDSDDRRACTSACEAVFFVDNVEGGVAGWTHEVVVEPPLNACGLEFCFKDLWTRTVDIPSIASHGEMAPFAWYSGNLSEVKGPGQTRLISPVIDLRDAVPPIHLSFDHFYAFKDMAGMAAYYADGAIVEVSKDGGPFEPVELSGYIGEIVDAANCAMAMLPRPNPLLGEMAFVGRTNSWITEVGDFDAYAGSQIRLGFSVASDCASFVDAVQDGEVEWWIDNVSVYGGLTAPTP